MIQHDQWSRLKPSYEFHFEGLSNFSPSVEGLVQIQDVESKNVEMKIQNSYEITWYMFPVQCEESRINHQTLLLVVTMPYACWFMWRAE